MLETERRLREAAGKTENHRKIVKKRIDFYKSAFLEGIL